MVIGGIGGSAGGAGEGDQVAFPGSLLRWKAGADIGDAELRLHRAAELAAAGGEQYYGVHEHAVVKIQVWSRVVVC